MEVHVIREELAKLHNSAFGWAMLCCNRDQDLAAEVLQQAYCRILGGDASFREKSEFSTWVFGVIRYVAREEHRYRKRQHQRYRPINSAVASSSATSYDDDQVEHRELAEQLGSAMRRLSDRQQEVLHLTFYENMTIEQAAHILEITVGSARQHYQRGKAALHRILAARPEFGDERRRR